MRGLLISDERSGGMRPIGEIIAALLAKMVLDLSGGAGAADDGLDALLKRVIFDLARAGIIEADYASFLINDLGLLHA